MIIKYFENKEKSFRFHSGLIIFIFGLCIVFSLIVFTQASSTIASKQTTYGKIIVPIEQASVFDNTQYVAYLTQLLKDLGGSSDWILDVKHLTIISHNEKNNVQKLENVEISNILSYLTKEWEVDKKNSECWGVWKSQVSQELTDECDAFKLAGECVDACFTNCIQGLKEIRIIKSITIGYDPNKVPPFLKSLTIYFYAHSGSRTRNSPPCYSNFWGGGEPPSGYNILDTGVPVQVEVWERTLWWWVPFRWKDRLAGTISNPVKPDGSYTGSQTQNVNFYSDKPRVYLKLKSPYTDKVLNVYDSSKILSQAESKFYLIRFDTN